MKKIIFIFMFFFLLLFTTKAEAYTLNTKEDKIYLGGETVGLKLNTGVKVVKTYALVDGINLLKPWEEAGIKEDDYIVSYNNKIIKSTKDLFEAIKEYKTMKVPITIKREDKEIKTSIKPVYLEDSYSLGLYVKDNISGLGTLTYVIPNSNIFGALGHQIDGVKDVGGNMYEATVTGIKKGSVGEAGSKIADIKTKNIGTIEKNTITGLHGIYKGKKSNSDLISVGKKEEVTLGYAQIRTCINQNEVEYFDIDIVSLQKQKSKDVKGIKFKVTDERLIDKANGIVQGMSGSPIIQNDKIIGAVTHVLINDPLEGYGIYIEFMLSDMDINLV